MFMTITPGPTCVKVLPVVEVPLVKRPAKTEYEVRSLPTRKVCTVPEELVTIGTPTAERVSPEWVPNAAVLSTRVVAFVMLAIVVFAGMSVLPLTNMPGRRPAVLATVTLVVLLVTALVRETGVPQEAEIDPGLA